MKNLNRMRFGKSGCVIESLLLVAIVSTFAPNVVLAQCSCGAGGSPMVADDSLDSEDEGGSVNLTVIVPKGAKLFVNCDPTAAKGKIRHFVVKHLDYEKTYKFVVVAETKNAAGVPLQQVKTLKLKAGDSETVILKPYKRKVTKEVTKSCHDPEEKEGEAAEGEKPAATPELEESSAA